MRVIGRFLMVGIVVGGLGLAAFGIARESMPELDERASEVGGVAWDLAENTVEGLLWLVRTSAQDRTDGQDAALEEFEVVAPATDEVDADWPDDPLDDVLDEPSVLTEPRPEDPYEATRHDLLLLRDALAAQQAAGHDVVPAAQAVLELYLPKLMDAWIGTPYSYSGTTEVPGEGSVACGYYVSTVLEHAGFVVERVELARQASEQIARSLVRDSEIERFSYAKRNTVVKAVKARGEGIFIVGLDTHAGFLVHRDDEVTFCHATRRGKLGVVCEKASSSPSMKSKYIVIGKVDDPHIVRSWLAGTPLTTAERDTAQDWPAPPGAEAEEVAAAEVDEPETE